MKRLVLVCTLLASPSFAQVQIDANKLAPIYQQQRNIEADARAQCYAAMIDLRARITELEKQLEDAKKPATKGK